LFNAKIYQSINSRSRIHGPVVEQGTCRIRTNQELREQYTNLDIAKDNKKKELEWIGQVVRMDHGRTLKIFESIPEGNRRGRPRLRRLEDA
jgi:hypothetical protein